MSAKHHGARVTQSSNEQVIAERVDSSVVGELGTAPDADATAFPLNQLTYVSTTEQLKKLGTAGTLYENTEMLLDLGATAVEISRIDEGADSAALIDNAVGDRISMTGINSFLRAGSLNLPTPKLILASGLPNMAAADGIATVTVTTPGSGYSDQTTVSISGDGGSGKGAVLKPIIVEGKLDAVIVANPGYDYTAPLTITVADAGGGVDAVCSGVVGQVKNPIVAEASGVTDTLRAMFYTDGPDTTDADAVAMRALIGDKRVFFADGRVLKAVNGLPTPMPSSTVHAGMQSVMDAREGPHWTGSNQVVNPILGTNRPVNFGAQSDYLNANGINTIINDDGLRTWGVWTCSDDPIWQFVNVVRTTDVVNETVERALRRYTDRPGNQMSLDFAVMTGQGTLKDFENDGMLLPGSSFGLSTGNSPAKGVQGIYAFDMAFEVPSPMAQIDVTAHRNITIGYTLLFNAFTGATAIAA